MESYGIWGMKLRTKGTPDLASCDLWLFQEPKLPLKGRKEISDCGRD